MNWSSPALVSIICQTSDTIDSEEVRRFYWEEGLSLTDIAGRFGVSRGTIRYILSKYKIPRRSLAKARALQQKITIGPEEIRRLYWDEELSQIDIAKRFGVSRANVKDFMKRYNIPRRSHTEATLLAVKLDKSKQGKGTQSANWKGGRCKTHNGYILIKIYEDNPYYSMANPRGYILEHRFVMAQFLGRPLEPWEEVHHKPPGIKDDNRIENLLLFASKAKHKEKQWEEFRTRITNLEARNINLEARVIQLEAENILLQNVMGIFTGC